MMLYKCVRLGLNKYSICRYNLCGMQIMRTPIQDSVISTWESYFHCGKHNITSWECGNVCAFHTCTSTLSKKKNSEKLDNLKNVSKQNIPNKIVNEPRILKTSSQNKLQKQNKKKATNDNEQKEINTKTKDKSSVEKDKRLVDLWQSLNESQDTTESNTKKIENELMSSQARNKVEHTSKKNIKQGSYDIYSKDVTKLLEDVGLEFHPEPKEVVHRRQMKNDLVKKMSRLQKPTNFDGKYKSDFMHERFKPKQKSYEENALGHPQDRKYRKPLGGDEQVSENMKIDLDSVGRLGIFSMNNKFDEVVGMNPDNTKWSAFEWYSYYNQEFNEKFNLNPFEILPGNAYDETIRLTEAGKLWEFPINNEQDMHQEASTPFHEHVFLEEKLNEKDWCPQKGPIRQLMSHILTALSLNPHLTVEEKHEHIDWFREYFLEKMKTLKKLGLISQE